jgi:hypothetical protein
MWRICVVACVACRYVPPGDNIVVDGPATQTDAAAAVPIASYEFDEGAGTTIHDGASDPLDLALDTQDGTEWITGALAITGNVRIRSAGAATKVIAACTASNEVSIEAWIKPATDGQTGPARVVGVSNGQLARNVTLAQSGKEWVFRLRVPGHDNGMPDLATTQSVIAAQPVLAHVVVTGDATSRRIYVDGVERAKDTQAGSFAGWDSGFPLVIANEETDSRPWHGELHRIRIFDRVLSPGEIATLHDAGP